LEKPEIARQILAYLAEHPDARDTLDGIAQWWLLERHIVEGTSAVKEALADLVSEGWIIAHESLDSRVHYQVEPSRHKEIQNLLRRARAGT